LTVSPVFDIDHPVIQVVLWIATSFHRPHDLADDVILPDLRIPPEALQSALDLFGQRRGDLRPLEFLRLLQGADFLQDLGESHGETSSGNAPLKHCLAVSAPISNSIAWIS